MDLLPVAVLVISAVGLAAEASPVYVYARCNVNIEGASNFQDGLIIVHNVDTCKKWVCDRRTNRGYIEQCPPKDTSAKCSDIDLYSRKCYKSYVNGDEDLRYPDCCAKQVEICPNDPGYDFIMFKLEESRYLKEEPFLWCARDSPV